MTEEITTSFLGAVRRTDNVTSFRFEDREGVDFRPGQFFQLFLDREDEELSHYFSFSNSPTEKGYLEFTKKLTSSPFSKELLALQPGRRVRVKLPLGSFIFEGQYPKAAFLSGGIGITPIRSICKYLTDIGSSSEATVLYSARSPRDFIFRDDFTGMKEANRYLSVVYTITDQPPPVGWEGRTGRITAGMVKEVIPDFREWIFYICGPPGMVEALTKILKDELGLKSEQVVFENFIGY